MHRRAFVFAGSAIAARKKSYHHGDLRRVLLEATLKWVERDGLSGFSLRALARKAGVSHGAPYAHYPDKDALLAELAVEGYAKLTEAMRAAVAKAKTPAARFEASGSAYVAFALAHKGFFRIMFMPGLVDLKKYPGVREASEAANRVLADIVVECQAAGLAKGLPADAVTLMGWSTAHGLAALLVDGPLSPDPPERAIKAVASSLGALLARSG